MATGWWHGQYVDFTWWPSGAQLSKFPRELITKASCGKITSAATVSPGRAGTMCRAVVSEEKIWYQLWRGQVHEIFLEGQQKYVATLVTVNKPTLPAKKRCTALLASLTGSHSNSRKHKLMLLWLASPHQETASQQRKVTHNSMQRKWRLVTILNGFYCIDRQK